MGDTKDKFDYLTGMDQVELGNLQASIIKAMKRRGEMMSEMASAMRNADVVTPGEIDRLDNLGRTCVEDSELLMMVVLRMGQAESDHHVQMLGGIMQLGLKVTGEAA